MSSRDKGSLSHMKLKLDLHVHSNLSRDSVSGIKQILAFAKRRGMNGMAITDHDVFGELPKKIKKDVLVIAGSEVRTEIGDLTGLFLTEPLKTRTSLSLIDEVRSQGGLVILPHPFKNHILSAKIVEKVDAVEAFNARTTLRDNLKARQLCISADKPMIAGSDAHFFWEVGRGWTFVPSASSEDDVRKAIVKGKTSVGGFQLPNSCVSMLYAMDKTVEGIKNPRIIPSMVSKMSRRILLGSGVT